jgi:hypothetical protein
MSFKAYLRTHLGSSGNLQTRRIMLKDVSEV